MGRAIGLASLVAVSLIASSCGSAETSPPPTTTGTTSFADLVDRVKSGIIRIEVATCEGTALGTGFLIKPRLVATVEHVVEGASSIKLKRNGKTLGSASLIGVDRDRDLALLRASEPIAGYDFGFAGKAPRLGEEVGAIGFPLGLPLTVTKGSVSGLDRVVPIGGVKRRRLVQTDAAVNPGNSGGPLLSIASGEVVGLVDLKNTEGSGVAFAVSAEVAAPLLRAWAVAPQPPAPPECDGGGAPAPGGPAVSAQEAYVDAVDSALIGSARTRGDLADLIDGVKSGSLAEDEARAEINSIIDQRQSLLSDATRVDAPPVFRRAAQLLRASLVSALDDDLAIEKWIKATYRGDDAEAARYWEQQLRLSTQTSVAKDSFLDAYNAQRRRLLGLPPLEVAY